MLRPQSAQADQKRWNQNGPTVQFMPEGITSGEIDISQQPNVTLCSSKDMHWTRFRAHVNKIRT